MPACTKFVVRDVGTICGYADVADWKRVLEVDAELVHQRVVAKQAGERASNLALQVTSLQGQIVTYAKSQELLLARTEKLSVDLIALDKKYQDERVKPRWGSALAWGVAAVASSLLAGVVIAKAL